MVRQPSRFAGIATTRMMALLGIFGVAMLIATGLDAIGWPLPWLIGAIIAGTLYTIARRGRVELFTRLHAAPVADPVKNVMLGVLGVLVGTRLNLEFLQRSDWLVLAPMVVLYVTVIISASYSFCRYAMGLDRVTALFAGLPGGMPEALALGAKTNADMRAVTIFQSTRLILIVAVAPTLIQIVINPEQTQALDVVTGPIGPAFWPNAMDLLVFALVIPVGSWIGRRLRIPAATLIGPMLVMGLINAIGLVDVSASGLVIIIAQMVIGVSAAQRFSSFSFRDLTRWLAGATLMTGTVVLLGALFALAGQFVTDAALSSLLIGFCPGGISEMNLVALVLGLDAGFIAVMQSARLFLVVLSIPLLLRLLDKPESR